MRIRQSFILNLGCLLLAGTAGVCAQEGSSHTHLLRETGSEGLVRGIRGDESAPVSLLDDNPLFQVEELKDTSVTTSVNKHNKSWNVFEARNNPDFAGDFSMKVEHKPHKMLTLTSEQRLGVQSRSDDDLLWGSTEERYEYADITGARFQPFEKFSVNARMETRFDLPQNDQVMTTRDNKIIEGSYNPWKDGTVTLGLENPTVTHWANDEVLEHNQVYRAEWRQGVTGIPVTTTIGTRVFERYDPNVGLDEASTTSPQLSGAVDWRPDDQVLLRFGARGEMVEDSLGYQTAEHRNVFAEYSQNLTERIDLRSRVSMDDHTNTPMAPSIPRPAGRRSASARAGR